MKQIPYWGTKNIRHHRKEFSRPDVMAPGICSPLYLCASYDSQNKQRLLIDTALTDSNVQTCLLLGKSWFFFNYDKEFVFKKLEWNGIWRQISSGSALFVQQKINGDWSILENVY
jgi:hypothetical protein